jgi:hypothetical protein
MPILILLKNLGRLPQSSLHGKSAQDGQSLVFLSQAIQRSISLSGAMHIKQKKTNQVTVGTLKPRKTNHV